MALYPYSVLGALGPSNTFININLFLVSGYEGAHTFPADFVQHVHELLDISIEKHGQKALSLLDRCGENSSAPIVIR